MKNLMRGISSKPVIKPSITSPTTISDIFINVFGELPSHTSLIDFKHLTLEQFVYTN